MSATTPSYKTTELELASFLKASGYQLTNVALVGKLAEFSFIPSAIDAVSRYFAGAQLPARELFEAHRSLRALIQQVKQHRTQTDQNGKKSNGPVQSD